MSYTVDNLENIITLDSNTVEADLSGLTGLSDDFGSPVVITSGGGGQGDQIIYTLVHPWVFEIKGTLTITPDTEQLFIANTDQRDNDQDFKIGNGGFLTVAGETNASFGTYYSPATWLRINRQTNDSFRPQKACFFIDANGGMDWRGGVAVGGAVFFIAGDNNDDAPSVFISNAIWRGLSGNMFVIEWNKKNYSSDAFTIMGNRLKDDRAGVYTFGYVAVASLIEGSHSQVFENYSGTAEYATWTRNMNDRKFLNSSFGMTLPVSVFTSNKTQQGGLIQVEKSATLHFVDTQRSPLSDVKVVVKTYDNGDRVNYPALPTASSIEASRLTDQTAVSDLPFTTDMSGQIFFNKLLKEYTCRDSLTSFDVSPSDITGSFSAEDQISLIASNSTRVDGEFVFHDTVENKMYFRRTRNLTLFYSSFVRMINLTQSGEAIWGRSHLDQGTTNVIARFTKDGDDYNPVGDVMSYVYGKQITTTELNYGGIGVLESTVFMLDDPFITEKDSSVVGSYTLLENTNKIYDFASLRLYNFYGGQIGLIADFVDGYLDFGYMSLVLDGTATAALTKSRFVYTIGVGTSERFVGNIKAASVTLVNGATTSGFINSGGVITPPLKRLAITGVVANSEVRVYVAGTSTELFGIEDTTGADVVGFVSVDSVDIVIHNVSQEYVRKTAVDTTDNLTLPIQQRFDRGYRNE